MEDQNQIETKAYDKAKWHFGADNFPKELEDIQGYIHIAFFFGWCVENNLTSDFFNEEYSKEKEDFLNKNITAVKLLEKMDGVLSSEELNEEGNNFATYYYDSSMFTEDYTKLKLAILPGIDYSGEVYAVKDTEENYNKVKQVVGKQYNKWKNPKKSLLNKLWSR